MLNGTTTRSPSRRFVIAGPTSSTMPIGSCPRMSPSVMNGPSTSYRCRSEPQMPLDVTLITASLGSWMAGSGTASTRTSRLPCHTTAFMSTPPSAASPVRLPFACTGKRLHRAGCDRSRCGAGFGDQGGDHAGFAVAGAQRAALAFAGRTAAEQGVDALGQVRPVAGRLGRRADPGEQAADQVRRAYRLAGDRIDEPAAQAGAGGPPGGTPQQL